MHLLPTRHSRSPARLQILLAFFTGRESKDAFYLSSSPRHCQIPELLLTEGRRPGAGAAAGKEPVLSEVVRRKWEPEVT